jgi:hypothetical protein
MQFINPRHGSGLSARRFQTQETMLSTYQKEEEKDEHPFP